jgi:hypothetical protein
MKKYLNFHYFLFVIVLFVLFACNQISDKNEETILKGEVYFVDETLTPIIEDQVDVLKMNMKLN